MDDLDNKVVFFRSRRGQDLDGGLVDTVQTSMVEYDGWGVTAVLSKAKPGVSQFQQEVMHNGRTVSVKYSDSPLFSRGN